MKKRRIALLLAGVLAIASLAGCKGKDSNDSAELGFNKYVFEETDLGVEQSEDNYINSFKSFNGNLYFAQYISPEYPPEYYEDLEKLNTDNDMEDMLKSSIEDKDKEAATEDTTENTTDEASVSDDKTSADEEVSDDDLIGNIDDLFGEDATPEPSTDDEPDDDTPAPDAGDNSGTMTYEEFEAKYAEYKSKNIISQYDMESGEVKTLIEFEENNNEYLQTYAVTSEGELLVIKQSSDYDDSTQVLMNKNNLEIYSESGELTNTVDLNAAVGSTGEDMCFGELMLDGNDNIILTGNENELYVLNADGSFKGKIKTDGYVDTFVLNSDGEIIISTYGEKGNVFSKLDVANLKVGDKVEGIIEEEQYSSYQMYTANDTYGMLLKDSQSLYAFKNGVKTELLKWMDSSLIGDSINSVVALDDGRFFIAMNSSDSEGIKAGYLSIGDASSDEEKTTIKIMCSYTDSEVQQRIIEFNKENDKYKVELVSFDNAEDSQVAINNAITSGDIPDIIRTSDIDIKNYAAKGILADLTPLLQADDTINEGYFTEGYLDAIKNDGKIYNLSRNFNIVTMAGKKSELSKYENGWTIKNLIDYYNSKPEGTSLFEYNSRNSVLDTVVIHDIDSYIDWKTGEVKFDTKEFKDALEFCKKFPSEDDMGDYVEVDVHKEIKEGKLLLNQVYISSFDDIQVNKALFDNDIMFVGYPCNEGIGTYIESYDSYGLCESSPNKEGAWEFLKYLITKVNEKEQYEIYEKGFPTSADMFEKVVKRYTATEKYTDEYGNEIVPRESVYGYGSYEVKIKPATEEEVQLVRNLIKQCRVHQYNYSINEMLTEDIEAYFSGSKSVDETTKIIQDKMSKYVNENK